MGRLVAQTSLQARTRNAVFATMDTNRKMGIPTRLMSTISPLRTQTAEQPRRAGVCFEQPVEWPWKVRAMTLTRGRAQLATTRNKGNAQLAEM
eukprot:scaffold62556_cov69-Phaeocystis_antarctica.AAC.4